MSSRIELDEAFELAVLDTWRLLASRGKYEDVVAAFEAVGATFAPRYEALGEPAIAQEVRRRVAEGILHAGFEARRSPAACELLLGRIIELGFSDLDRKANILTAFCGHFAEIASKKRLLPYLEPLMAELEAAHARTGEDVWHNHLRACQRIRARIDARWRKNPRRSRAARRRRQARA